MDELTDLTVLVKLTAWNYEAEIMMVAAILQPKLNKAEAIRWGQASKPGTKLEDYREAQSKSIWSETISSFHRRRSIYRTNMSN